MADYILPGAYGFGTTGFGSSERAHYEMARRIVSLSEHGITVDPNNPQYAESLNAMRRFFGSDDPNVLKQKI